MKISVKTAAIAAAALAWPLVGWSQVVVGGIMDGGVRLDSGTTTGSIKSQGSGLQAGSRLTISGIEDMGGGLKAGFVLESGMAIDTGTGVANPPGTAAGSITWGRTSAVAVGSDSAGYLSFGRQYTPLWAASAGPMNDPFGGTWLGGIGSLYSFVRIASNSVVYSYGYTPRAMLLPAPRTGLGVAVMYAPSEQGSPLTAAGEMFGFNVSYGNGTYWVGYAYHQQKGSNPAISATAPVTDTPLAKYQTLGASYLVAGFARLHVGLNVNTNDGVGAAAVDRRNWHVGATVPLAGLHTVRFLYGSSDDRTTGNADFKNWQLGYQYDLSKRTNVYAGVGALDNSANSAAILSGAVGTYAKGATNRSYIAGARHNF